MTTDPIADFLIRIKNGYMAHKESVSAQHSKLKVEIAQILVKKGFLTSVEVSGDVKKTITVKLGYRSKVANMENVRKISVPSRRVYIGAKDIKKVQGGLGFAIISTPKGVMDAGLARKQNLGGEVICEVW